MRPTSNPTVDQVRLPLPLRLLNRAAEVLSRSGLALADLSEERLMHTAEQQAGLSDWGPDEFRPALKALLNSYEREAHMTPLARLAAQQDLIRLLWNRLRIQDDLKQHPDILSAPIHRPLLIAGYPRTGTTLLHNLLAQDPQARVPLAWEFAWPSLPPTPENRKTDWRSQAAQMYAVGIRLLNPQLSSIHPLSPTGPEECSLLFQHQFVSLLFYLVFNTPSYLKWLLQHEMVPEYRYHRQVLQLLQWHRPSRHWILKSPQHLLALDALLTVFPDACVVQMHRDPQKVVPSFASLTAALRRMGSDRTDLKEIGQECLNLLALITDRATGVRQSTDPERFYDVHYHELIADPIGVVRRIYDYFHYEASPEMVENTKRWLSENPQHKHGVHRYSLEQFGLDREVVAARFAAYVERFNVKPEQS